MLHLHSEILRGMHRINAWFGWLNSTSAPVRTSVWYNSQRVFYCHQRKACSSKIHLSCFRWIIWIQLIYPTRTHLSSLTMIISAINVCAVQHLPLVTQISFWLRAQIINMPETLHQAFFDCTILCTCKINASYIILLHTVKVADFWPRYRDWTWKLCSSHAKWSSFFFRCCMSTPGK